MLSFVRTILSLFEELNAVMPLGEVNVTLLMGVLPILQMGSSCEERTVWVAVFFPKTSIIARNSLLIS